MGFKYPSSQRGSYPDGVDKAPAEEGVYGIFKGSRCIYVGMSEDDIRDRLQAHAGGYSSKARCINGYSPTYYLYEDSSDYSGSAGDREQELIDEYNPPCN